MNITIIGAGAWGTALAHSFAAHGQNVTLFGRDKAVLEEIATSHTNEKYLQGAQLDARIATTPHLALATEYADAILMVVPSHALRMVGEALEERLPKTSKAPLILATKGMERETLFFPTKIMADVFASRQRPCPELFVLSGPSFALEVATSTFTQLTLASVSETKAKQWAGLLSSENLRILPSGDITGTQIAGIFKNMVAIGIGILEGLGKGQNTRAAFFTRGLQEIQKFMVLCGGSEKTAIDICCVGDLLLTALSHTSRNYAFGYKLAQTGLYDSKTTVEGLASAPSILHLLEALTKDAKSHVGIFSHVSNWQQKAEITLAGLQDSNVAKESFLTTQFSLLWNLASVLAKKQPPHLVYEHFVA